MQRVRIGFRIPDLVDNAVTFRVVHPIVIKLKDYTLSNIAKESNK